MCSGFFSLLCPSCQDPPLQQGPGKLYYGKLRLAIHTINAALQLCNAITNAERQHTTASVQT